MDSGLGQNISQELKQVQRLSPMQMQLVRLLEMSAPEIDEEVRRQLDDNPALIAVDASEHHDDDFGETPEQLQRADYATEEDAPPVPSSGRAFDDTFRPEIQGNAQTLQENLAEQINRTSLPPAISRAALYIIGNLDNNGYLSRSLRAMETDLEVAGINISHEDMRKAFEQVRALDPPGVGAVDLRDCLLLQLRRLSPRPQQEEAVALATEIVADFFDLLGKKHYERLMREMNISDPEKLRNALDVIRALNPKPGGTSSGDGESAGAASIIPDFSVEIEGDRAVVNLLSNAPELQIEETFAREADRKNANRGRDNAFAFIKLKRDEAAAFIEVLRRRSETMLAVMRGIVHFQWDFFLTGDTTMLRPLVLRELSAYTGLDISVISRATQGKYVSTPWGIFPLKMFFNERTSEDSDLTSHTLLDAVRQVIEQENPSHPLSDQAICKALAERGITMARRTVTKYRERLGLPPGRLRKKI